MSTATQTHPMTPRWWILVAGIGILLTQIAVPGFMILDRISLLTSGREITIKTQPRDPRDMFKGDYVVLNYPITQIDTAGVTAPEETLYKGDEVYAVIVPKDGDAWSVISLGREKPDQVTGEQVVLMARVEKAYGDKDSRKVTLHYGIESYYIPEGTGKALEDKVRDGSLSVIVAVSDAGLAAIKGLVIDGERVYDEPLF